jgi:hypothetical protein
MWAKRVGIVTAAAPVATAGVGIVACGAAVYLPAKGLAMATKSTYQRIQKIRGINKMNKRKCQEIRESPEYAAYAPCTHCSGETRWCQHGFVDSRGMCGLCNHLVKVECFHYFDVTGECIFCRVDKRNLPQHDLPQHDSASSTHHQLADVEGDDTEDEDSSWSDSDSYSTISSDDWSDESSDWDDNNNIDTTSPFYVVAVAQANMHRNDSVDSIRLKQRTIGRLDLVQFKDLEDHLKTKVDGRHELAQAVSSVSSLAVKPNETIQFRGCSHAPRKDSRISRHSLTYSGLDTHTTPAHKTSQHVGCGRISRRHSL